MTYASLAGSYGSSGGDDGTLFVLIFVAAVCGFIGAALGSSRSIGAGAGFFLGLLLGPLGLIIVAVSGRKSALERVQTQPDAAGWHPDPLGRFDGRYHNGHQWTQHVGRVMADGTRQQFEDPL